jgi:hypothetical protein
MEKILEMSGIEPEAFLVRNGLSTTELHPLLKNRTQFNAKSCFGILRTKFQEEGVLQVFWRVMLEGGRVGGKMGFLSPSTQISIGDNKYTVRTFGHEEHERYCSLCPCTVRVHMNFCFVQSSS